MSKLVGSFFFHFLSNVGIDIFRDLVGVELQNLTEEEQKLLEATSMIIKNS
ncbi:hypothetical protein [Niallia circulans]|uniref:hypothetical protein n=1 Tax=Niallia circulans TaxID=1397 RepID=UPI0019CFEFBF|nr:hypothetical protein [Niallia circulans]